MKGKTQGSPVLDLGSGSLTRVWQLAVLNTSSSTCKLSQRTTSPRSSRSSRSSCCCWDILVECLASALCFLTTVPDGLCVSVWEFANQSNQSMVCRHRGSKQGTMNLFGVHVLFRCCKRVITNLFSFQGLVRGSKQDTTNLFIGYGLQPHGEDAGNNDLGVHGLLRCCKRGITNLLGAYCLASCHTQATTNLIGLNCLVRGCTQAATSLIGVNVWSGVAPKQQQTW